MSTDGVTVQSFLEHVRLRSSWTITVPSQSGNAPTSVSTLSSSRSPSELLQSRLALFSVIASDPEHRRSPVFGSPSGRVATPETRAIAGTSRWSRETFKPITSPV
jgi:hypothetical protein